MVCYKPVKGWWWSFEYIKNHICELLSEELNEELYTRLLQLQKESLKKIQAFFATGKVVYITTMIILHLNLHSTVHIHCIWFSYVQNGNIIVKNDITYNRSKVNSKFCNLCAIVNLWSGKLQVKHWEKKHADYRIYSTISRSRL